MEITRTQVKKILMRAGEEELIQSSASSCWSVVKDSHWWSYGWRISVANREGVCSWDSGWLVSFDVYCLSIQAFEQTFAISPGRWKNANNRVGGIRGLGKSNACIWKYFWHFQISGGLQEVDWHGQGEGGQKTWKLCRHLHKGHLGTNFSFEQEWTEKCVSSMWKRLLKETNLLLMPNKTCLLC